MRSSEKFFNVAAPLFAIAIFAMAVISGIVTGNTVNWWAAAGVFLLGIVLMVLFVKGMNIWNEYMYSDAAEKAKSLLFKISILGVCILLIGCLSFMASPTDYAVNCLTVGALVFVAPVLIASLCGLIRFISNRIEIYRIC